jgi:hypothetical protein
MRRLATVLLSGLAGACGAPAGPTLPHDEEWHVWAWEGGGTRWPGIAEQEFIEGMPPEAWSGSDEWPLEDERPARLHLLTDGGFKFRADTHPPTAIGAPDKDHLRRALDEALSTGLMLLSVQANRDARWRAFETVLAAIVEDPRLRRFEVWVARADAPRWRTMRFRLVPSSASEADPAIEFDRPDGKDTVELRVGGRGFSLPVPHEFDDEPFVREANARWREFRAALNTSVSAGAIVRLEEGDFAGPVPVAHVVKVLDLLLRLGVAAVEIPRIGVRLDPIPEPTVPRTRSRHDLPSPVVLIAAAAAFVLAMGWALANPRGARRARPGGPPGPGGGIRSPDRSAR